MVDVSSQNNSVSINVSSSGTSASIKATPDTALFYSEKSREWAISNRIVDGVDYSSKYYANKANESATKAEKVIEDVKSEAQTQISAIQDVSILEQEQIQEIINGIDDGKAVYMGEDEPTDPIYSVWVSPEDNELSADIKQLSSDVENIKTNIKGKITNCITEIPQRIKYTLENGILTIKAGSVVIVPYGVEDLTTTYPVGSIFINDNFKVVDTQFSDGKFFVCIEFINNIVVDFSSNTSVSDRCFCLYIKDTDAYIFGFGMSESGEGLTSSQTYTMFYSTSLNKVLEIGGTLTSINDAILSLPIFIADTIQNTGITSIKQMFNGIGYIGSTVWIDKGVKGLIPNGRNEDGTLKNTEITTSKIVTYSRNLNGNVPLWLKANGDLWSTTGIKYNYITNTVNATAVDNAEYPACQ